MKKIIILTAISLFTASSVFAATIALDVENKTGLSVWGSKTTAAAGTGLIGKTSTGVGVGLESVKAGYGVITQHTSGTKVFGSTFDSTSIYSKDVTKVGTSETVTLTTGTDSFPSASWTTM